MSPTIPPSPPSSSASARVIVLRPESSRLLRLWWLALHLLLLAAAVLVGVAWWAKALAALAIALHGLARRLPATPATILVAEDGACCVPSLDSGWLEPGPRTLLAGHWLRLSLADAARAHDILLCADQIDAASWARLNARLRRRAVAGTLGAPAAQRADRADLR